MSDEFRVLFEDDSSNQIALLLKTLQGQLSVRDTTLFDKMKDVYEKKKNVTPQAQRQGDSDDDGDGESDDGDGDSDEEMADASEETVQTRYQKPERVIDDDGFELVRKSRSRRN